MEDKGGAHHQERGGPQRPGLLPHSCSGPGDVGESPGTRQSSSERQMVGKSLGQRSAHLQPKETCLKSSPLCRLTDATKITDTHEGTRHLLPHANHRGSLNPPAGHKYYPRWTKSATRKCGEGQGPQGQGSPTHAAPRQAPRSPANSRDHLRQTCQELVTNVTWSSPL